MTGVRRGMGGEDVDEWYIGITAPERPPEISK